MLQGFKKAWGMLGVGERNGMGWVGEQSLVENREDAIVIQDTEFSIKMQPPCLEIFDLLVRSILPM